MQKKNKSMQKRKFKCHLPMKSLSGLRFGTEPAKFAVNFSTPFFCRSGICFVQSNSTNSCFSENYKDVSKQYRHTNK